MRIIIKNVLSNNINLIEVNKMTLAIDEDITK